MPRNRHKKSPPKAAQSPQTAPPPPQPAAAPPPAEHITPAAKKVLNRIALGGETYLEQNIYRLMTKSGLLAAEPEFSHFPLDGVKAAQATQRWMEKYQKRQEAADRKGKEASIEVFNEMRVKLFNELAVPKFRKEVDTRLEALANRLMTTVTSATGAEADKLEMALMLRPMLKERIILWGECWLILTIYQNIVDPIIQMREDQEMLFDAMKAELQEAAEKDPDPVEIIESIESSDKLEQISQKIFAANPGLRKRLENQVIQRAEAFEGELFKGRIELDFFTQEEIGLFLQRLQAEIDNPTRQNQPLEERQANTFQLARQMVKEIMTPERFKRFRQDVETKANDLLHRRQKWAPELLSELTWLEGDEYEENKFYLAAYLGQIRRTGEAQINAEKGNKRR